MATGQRQVIDCDPRTCRYLEDPAIAIRVDRLAIAIDSEIIGNGDLAFGEFDRRSSGDGKLNRVSTRKSNGCFVVLGGLIELGIDGIVFLPRSLGTGHGVEGLQPDRSDQGRQHQTLTV